MKTLDEAKKGTPEEINQEIRERRNLMSQMVGQLYPSVLWDEVVELRHAYIEKTGRYDYAG